MNNIIFTPALPLCKAGIFLPIIFDMNKQDLWPGEGKLKKGLIILTIVIIGSLLLTLLEEKTRNPFTKRIPFVIAFACIGIWLYKPAKNEKP